MIMARSVVTVEYISPGSLLKDYLTSMLSQLEDNMPDASIVSELRVRPTGERIMQLLSTQPFHSLHTYARRVGFALFIVQEMRCSTTEGIGSVGNVTSQLS